MAVIGVEPPGHRTTPHRFYESHQAMGMWSLWPVGRPSAGDFKEVVVYRSFPLVIGMAPSDLGAPPIFTMA